MRTFLDVMLPESNKSLSRQGLGSFLTQRVAVPSLFLHRTSVVRVNLFHLIHNTVDPAGQSPYQWPAITSLLKTKIGIPVTASTDPYVEIRNTNTVAQSGAPDFPWDFKKRQAQSFTLWLKIHYQRSFWGWGWLPQNKFSLHHHLLDLKFNSEIWF